MVEWAEGGRSDPNSAATGMNGRRVCNIIGPPPPTEQQQKQHGERRVVCYYYYYYFVCSVMLIRPAGAAAACHRTPSTHCAPGKSIVGGAAVNVAGRVNMNERRRSRRCRTPVIINQ